MYRILKKPKIYGAIFLALSLIVSSFAPAAETYANDAHQRTFSEVAKEFNIPEEVLLAVSYNKSRWQDHEGKPSVDGGFGPMHLRDIKAASTFDGRGDGKKRERNAQETEADKTLSKAASILNEPEETLKSDYKQNVRGGAAVLREYAKELNEGKTPKAPEDWYAAVARFSNATDIGMAESFADNVYETIKQGQSNISERGFRVNLERKPWMKYEKRHLEKLERLKERFKYRKANKNNGAECPRTITCKYVPAHFAQNNPEDPYDYGNYDEANRPKDIDINYIVVHNMEGSYDSSIAWFQDPASYVSAHYLIRSSDGEVTQMVKNKDTAWHAGNWYMNMHSIGVEHEGFAAEGASWYTMEMYRSSAELVKYLAKKHDIPLDRDHILGHDEYMGVNPDANASMHYDPGPFWDWELYMNLLGAPVRPDGGRPHQAEAVTIAPRFKNNKPEVSTCEDGECTNLPEQSANFVYLRTEPNSDAPLLKDAATHPDGDNATTEISDTSAKAAHGQRYAVADRSDDWTAIWFNGQKGWFHNPNFTNSRTAKVKRITPKEGVAEVPIYGRPVPEESAYPDDFPTQLPLTPLQYTMPAGQVYTLADKKVPNDYYHVWTFDRSDPGDGTIIVGNEKYYAVNFNHRHGFVKASDVDILR